MEARREQNAPRVLIVDDHEDNVELLRARLESWGYRAEAAGDGAEALRMIEASPPDLVLLDVMMPKMDGIEVARRVKGNPALPFIPIIMQTALDATENKVEGLEAGADDYITKPIDFAELKARLTSMLRIKGLQDQLEDRERKLINANEQLRHMSQTDPLTGLDNRRNLEERLSEMFEHARRLNEAFSCVMCDLDRFKSVNDSYGHQAGDAVLKQFAQILKDEAREIDRVGRYGGQKAVRTARARRGERDHDRPHPGAGCRRDVRGKGAKTSRVTYIHVRRNLDLSDGQLRSFGMAASAPR